MNILIVDDSKSIHSFVTDIFKPTAHVLTHVYSGEEALQQLEKQCNFDVVLLDWEMPGLNGPDTLVKMRKKHSKLKIIMMTSKNKIEDLTLAIERGASEYIMKPFSSDILLSRLDEVCGEKF